LLVGDVCRGVRRPPDVQMKQRPGRNNRLGEAATEFAGHPARLSSALRFPGDDKTSGDTASHEIGFHERNP
jgi:hypothetical protein